VAVGRWPCKVIMGDVEVIMGDVEVRVSPYDMAALALVLLHSC
jgi:hypothetical protein